jgi:hypothetical protein
MSDKAIAATLSKCPKCGARPFFNHGRGLGKLGGRFYFESVTCRKCPYITESKAVDGAIKKWENRAAKMEAK